MNELPKNILIVSDMEFDSMMGIYSRWVLLIKRGSSTETLIWNQLRQSIKAHGYILPRLIFWNVCSRTNTIPLKENEAGVALVRL